MMMTQAANKANRDFHQKRSEYVNLKITFFQITYSYWKIVNILYVSRKPIDQVVWQIKYNNKNNKSAHHLLQKITYPTENRCIWKKKLTLQPRMTRYYTQALHTNDLLENMFTDAWAIATKFRFAQGWKYAGEKSAMSLPIKLTITAWQIDSKTNTTVVVRMQPKN